MRKRTILTLILLLALFLYTGAGAESSRPTGARLPTAANENTTTEAFFANGTPITIREPKADTEGMIHDAEVQAGLANGLSAEKKPGNGATICWEEADGTHYVYVSGHSKVFGGSLNADVQADIQITVIGQHVRKSFPNVSFLFGGGYRGDVIGNISISLEESQMMYVYGGSYNGSVTGDVRITSTGSNWSLDLVGGGLASSMTEDAVADVGGSVTLDLKGVMISYMDTLVAGGLAQSISEHAAQANVGGSVTLYAEGRNVYQLCGGGEAFRMEETCGHPTANVAGGVSVELRDSRIRYYQQGKVTLLGGVFGGGLGYYGTATVSGDISVTVADTVFDEQALGVVLGGMAEGDTALADVAGSAAGRILSGANPANVVRGCIEHDGGAAEVKGDVDWSYTLADGLTDY
jgi:hypothetical protein